jgi:hypothetical protein
VENRAAAARFLWAVPTAASASIRVLVVLRACLCGRAARSNSHRCLLQKLAAVQTLFKRTNADKYAKPNFPSARLLYFKRLQYRYRGRMLRCVAQA